MSHGTENSVLLQDRQCLLFLVLEKRFLVVVLLATRVLELHFAVTGLLVTTLTRPFLPIFTAMGTTEGSRLTRERTADQCSGDIRFIFFVVFSAGLLSEC